MMTSFIDGSFIYGSGEVWANALRRFTGGHLKTRGGDGLFPAYNKIGLPLKRYPSPVSHKSAKLEDLWSRFSFEADMSSDYSFRPCIIIMH